MFAKVRVIFEQSGAHLLTRLRPDGAEAQGQHELSVAGREVNLTGARDVAVFRALVFPLHLKMFGDPAIRPNCPTNPTDIFFHGAEQASARAVPSCSARNIGRPL